jgi:hypothetical protein
MSEVEREEAAVAKTVMAAAVMETTERAAVVTTMTVAAVAALNGKVSGSDREGSGGVSKGTLARK